MKAPMAPRCGGCRHYTGEPHALEAAIPGLNILSSAYGSVRADTGLCGRHESFVRAASAACAEFTVVGSGEGSGLPRI